MTSTYLIYQPVVEIIVCTKGLLVENPSKARWQAQDNTRERETRLQDHSNASVQDLGWPSY